MTSANTQLETSYEQAEGDQDEGDQGEAVQAPGPGNRHERRDHGEDRRSAEGCNLGPSLTGQDRVGDEWQDRVDNDPWNQTEKHTCWAYELGGVSVGAGEVVRADGASPKSAIFRREVPPSLASL